MLQYDIVVVGAGSAGALLDRAVEAAEVIAYPDLGPEAIRKLTVRDLPTICIHDVYGGDQYYAGQSQWVKPNAMVKPRSPQAAE